MFQYASSQRVYTLSMYVCSPSMYVCSPSWYVCLPGWYVCMYAKLVCMFAELVCMYTKLVFVWGNSCSRDEVRFLTKTYQYLTFNSIFQDLWGGVRWMAQISRISLPVKLVIHIHTYQLSNQKPSTGSGVLKNPPQGQDFWNIHTFTYIHTSLALEKPPQGEEFWKTLHKHSTFETYIPTSQSAAFCKYAFQNHPPCEGFLLVSMYVPKPLCLS